MQVVCVWFLLMFKWSLNFQVMLVVSTPLLSRQCFHAYCQLLLLLEILPTKIASSVLGQVNSF